MQHFKTTCAISALIAVGFAQGAAADISADEAWAALRDTLAGSGYTTGAKESREGDVLVLSDTVFTMTVDPDQSHTIDMGTLRFVETGDGSVRVDMPASLPVTTSFTDPETNQPVSVDVDVTQAGATLVMSGTPDNITQSYSADQIGVVLGQIGGAPDQLPADALRLTVNMSDLESATTIRDGDPRPMEMSASASAATFDMAVDVPGEGRSAVSGELSALTFDGTGTLPVASAGGDVYDMIQAGYAFAGTFAHEGGRMSISGEEDGKSFTAESSSQSGTLETAFNGDSVTYNIAQTDTTISAMLADLPFPLEITAAALEAGMTLPLSESDEPSDFALVVNLQDFEMSDMIWAMLDPQSILPRDPASLLVDLAGKATVFANLLDPKAVAELEQTETMPGQLDALDIKSVDLDMIGAQLTGSGNFTFDNSDRETFGGMPRPTGVLDLTLRGGNALLDKLSEMGMVGPQEAGSARMMMGLLAVPGDSPDTLKSKIEINKQGHITANGQRIQ